MARPGSRDTDDRTDSQLLAPNTPNESLFADAYNLMPKASDQQYEIPKGTATTVDNTGQHTATFGMNEIQNDLRLNPYTKLMGPEQAIADTGVAQYRVAAQECLRLNRPDLAVKNLCEELKVLQQFPTSQSGRLMYSALNSLADIALLSGDCNTARQLYNVANNCVQTYL
ncbi:MAG: hypothetical protein HY711_06945, partial [Candidatus Melainabacteria bacterium]|nr:hypothetical protein [Candidatus Melainabacteria bacterium]